MNEMQRKVLIAVAVLILGMLLYPPFEIQTEGVGGLFVGYMWLFERVGYASVDFATLFAQWLGVLIVGGLAYLLAKTK